jgi:hypothetical protein
MANFRFQKGAGGETPPALAGEDAYRYGGLAGGGEQGCCRIEGGVVEVDFFDEADG